MYDPKTKMHHCDACGRTMNPTDNLTDMRLAPSDPRRQDRTQLPPTMGVCPAAGCWKSANEQGFFSSAQLARQEES